MAAVSFFADLLLHLDKHLADLMGSHGTAAYVLMFIVIFCETGLVVTPFLPGDSLVFAAGAFAAAEIVPWPAAFLLMAAAVLGNMCNYGIGRYLRKKVGRRRNLKLIKREHIEQTQRFFEKHGAATIIVSRFMPLLRTFAPFVAGIGSMPYGRFFIFNAIGGISWAGVYFLSGYFFGGIPFVRQNFSLAVVGIVAVTILPAVVTFFKNLCVSNKKSRAQDRIL